MSYQQYGWKWSSGSGEKDDNVKSIQTEVRPMTDNQKSSLKLSAQVTPNQFEDIYGNYTIYFTPDRLLTTILNI